MLRLSYLLEHGGVSSMQQFSEGPVVLESDGAELITDGQWGEEVHGC